PPGAARRAGAMAGLAAREIAAAGTRGARRRFIRLALACLGCRQPGKFRGQAPYLLLYPDSLRASDVIDHAWQRS
ncbi:hypothetical protein, partial [Burkholderia glumae]|uniref:hypothetical protein n=1 Tax=Burkholderia glumae TaxID=337 RepID=UPI0019D6E9B6